MLLWYSLFLLAPDLVQVEGCDSGWTQNRATGSCYKILYPDIMTWDVAKSRCAGLGAELVSIRSNQENEFVEGLVMPLVESNKMRKFWMGGQKSGSGWKWTDGSEVTYFGWHRRQPNNYGGNQNCLMMSSRRYRGRKWYFGWDDQGCEIASWTAICKKPAPTNCRCGLAKRQSGGRIVGGETTEVNEYPWKIFVLIGRWDCAGSLLSDQWMLTAAHCIDFGTPESSIKVRLGEHNIRTSSESQLLKLGIEKIVYHPNFDWETYNYDLALLKLEAPVNFNAYPHIRPICLPESTNNNYAGYDAIATGWGRLGLNDVFSNVLRDVTVKVITNAECKATSYADEKIFDSMLCAGVPNGGKDSCSGDSGGALMTSGAGNGVTPGQNYELIGVTSWGEDCAKAEYPGVYARVTKALNWIKTTISGSRMCSRT